MKYDTGTTNVPSAGTRVQLSNTTNRVRSLKVKALAGNSGLVYLGGTDVSASNGYELAATNTIEINFAESGGTVAFSTFYVDAATNGDDVDYAAWTE